MEEGFKRIDKQLRELIVVKTEVLNRYVNYADKLQDQVFKNTIFYGDFGSGKTAFFDYLGEILLRNKILPIRLSLWPVRDVDTNIHTFEQELLYNTIEECSRYKVDVLGSEKLSYQQQIRNNLRILKEQRAFKGFVIVVDDLHKNPKAFDAVIDFLSYLQIFTSSIIGSSDLRIALYVAGVPAWKDRISSDPRLTGSLIREEIFPEIRELEASEMLNKRLLAYSKNPDKKSSIIGIGFVKQVYSSLKEGQQSITFREFLKRALAEFKNGNFDILTVNPKAIPTEHLHQIKDVLLTRPKLNYQFEKLLSLLSNANEENKQKCFELLSSIYLDGSISEKSQKFERSKWALQQLERCALIRPVQGAEVKWVIGKEMLETNKDIIEKYGVSMEDYLVPLFVGSPISKKKVVEIPENEVLNSLLQDKLAQNIELMIKETVRLHKHLADIDRTHSIDIVPAELVQKCVMSLSSLTKAFLLSQNIMQLQNDDLEVLMFWNDYDFGYLPPDVIEFTNQVIEHKQSLDIHKANYIFGLYKDAFRSLADFVKEQHEKDKIFSIMYADLTKEDCKVIYEAREHWYHKEYFEASTVVAEHLEKQLRETVFNIFVLQYGPFEKRIKRLDEDAIRKRLFENISKDEKKGLSRAVNELQYLDRKDYKNLMTKSTKTGHQNWEEIFKYVFYPWSEDDMERFLNTFADLNTATSHLKEDVISAAQQNKLFQFIVGSMSFFQMMNRSYRILIDSALYETGKSRFFSLHKFQDKQTLTEISITNSDATKVIQRFKTMEDIFLSLNNAGFIETFYNIEYRIFVAIVSRLLHVSEEDFERARVRLKITKDKSPVFRVKLEEKV